MDNNALIPITELIRQPMEAVREFTMAVDRDGNVVALADAVGNYKLDAEIELPGMTSVWTTDDAQMANEMLRKGAALKKEVKEFFEQPARLADAIHGVFTGKRGELFQGIDETVEALKTNIREYTIAQQAREAAERERLQKIADEQAAAETKRRQAEALEAAKRVKQAALDNASFEAKVLQDAGMVEEAQQIMAEAKNVVVPVECVQEVQAELVTLPAEKTGTQMRDNYEYEVTDIGQFLGWIIEHQMFSCVKIVPAEMKKLASMHRLTKIPGLKVWNNPTVVTPRGR
jgi:hypothetical protein